VFTPHIYLLFYFDVMDITGYVYTHTHTHSLSALKIAFDKPCNKIVVAIEVSGSTCLHAAVSLALAHCHSERNCLYLVFFVYFVFWLVPHPKVYWRTMDLWNVLVCMYVPLCSDMSCYVCTETAWLNAVASF
jgi:hypothetical protein